MSDSELNTKRQLDNICDEFEKNWSPDNRIDIAKYLKRVEERYRDQLLRMLVEIDVELRIKSDLTFDENSYAKLGQSAVELVKGLLKSDENSLNQFDDENSQVLRSTQSHTPTSGTSKKIGPYRLLQQIGEGGMGSVWMAEQEKPVRRRVAVKIIKSGKVDKQFIARFEAERQALALMDHQNIAKVLDAGTADDGSPFLVMELIQGVPITEYCDRNKLSPKERLELFIPICNAIQHAHQKGIIHRDLKPANVLVCIQDEKMVPKVIDFGLAKSIQHQVKLTEKTMFTEFGQVLGTVQYMSPEQAVLDALDVDTRTDVYSLGVMLYELLSGSTPVDQETMKQNALLKVLEIIREKDPPRPSMRLASSKESIHTISEQRHIHPSRLAQILRDELDWIVMKALEKDRTRRYKTANDLAGDMERYLRGEAVVARPPSAAYRISKFVKKNRVVVAAIMAVFVTSITAAIVSLNYGFRANQSRIAEYNAKQEAIEQRDTANQSLDLAIEAVKQYYTGIAYDVVLKQPRFKDLRLRLLEKPLSFFEKLKANFDQDSSELGRFRLATACFSLFKIHRNYGNETAAGNSLKLASDLMTNLIEVHPHNQDFLILALKIEYEQPFHFLMSARRRSRGEIRYSDQVLDSSKRALTYAQRLSNLKSKAPTAMVSVLGGYVQYILFSDNGWATNEEIENGTATVDEKILDQAISIAQSLKFEDWQDDYKVLEAANICNELSMPILYGCSRLKEADEILSRCIYMFDQMPQQSEFKFGVFECLDRRIKVRKRLLSAKDLVVDRKHLYRLRTSELERNPTNLSSKTNTARAALGLGQNYLEIGDLNNGELFASEASSLLKQVIESDASRVNAVIMLQMAEKLRGEVLIKLGRYQKAIAAFEAAGNIENFHGNASENANDVQILYAKAKLGQTDEVLKRAPLLARKLKPLLAVRISQALLACIDESQPKEFHLSLQSKALQVMDKAFKHSFSVEERLKIKEQLSSSDFDVIRKNKDFESFAAKFRD